MSIESAVLLALLLLLVPPALGGLAGAAYARRRGRLGCSPRAVVAAGVVLVAATFGVAWVATWGRVGVWDGLQAGLLFGLGLVAGAAELQRRVSGAQLLVAVLAGLVALGGAEVAARSFLPPAASLPPITAARLFLDRIDTERMISPPWHFASALMLDACSYLYPARSPQRFAERTAHAGGKPVVLHLGDSMAFGTFVQPQQAYPMLLDQRDGTRAHVSAATPGTSVDYDLLVARHWMDRLPVSLVVLHLFMNDVVEIDEGMPCCKDGPLLEYVDGEPRERCPVPTFVDGFGETFSWMLHNSPAPYPLRVATGVSDLARHVDIAFMARVSAIKYNSGLPLEQKWRHVEVVLRALRDETRRRGVPLVAVILPVRQSLEAPDPTHSEGFLVNARMRAVCEQLGIPVLDPWDELAILVRRDGAARYFVGPDDIHFAVDGHVAVADWLGPRLEPLGR